MRIRHTALLLAMATAPICSAAAQTYACLSASDSLTINLRTHIVWLVTTADTSAANDRVMYQLPMTTTNKVTVVTNANLCSQAGAAYHSAVTPPGTPAVSRTVMSVLKVGNDRYVVRDWSHGAGGYGSTMVFDKHWNALAGTSP